MINFRIFLTEFKKKILLRNHLIWVRSLTMPHDHKENCQRCFKTHSSDTCADFYLPFWTYGIFCFVVCQLSKLRFPRSFQSKKEVGFEDGSDPCHLKIICLIKSPKKTVKLFLKSVFHTPSNDMRLNLFCSASFQTISVQPHRRSGLMFYAMSGQFIKFGVSSSFENKTEVGFEDGIDFLGTRRFPLFCQCRKEKRYSSNTSNRKWFRTRTVAFRSRLFFYTKQQHSQFILLFCSYRTTFH